MPVKPQSLSIWRATSPTSAPCCPMLRTSAVLFCFVSCSRRAMSPCNRLASSKASIRDEKRVWDAASSRGSVSNSSPAVRRRRASCSSRVFNDTVRRLTSAAAVARRACWWARDGCNPRRRSRIFSASAAMARRYFEGARGFRLSGSACCSTGVPQSGQGVSGKAWKKAMPSSVAPSRARSLEYFRSSNANRSRIDVAPASSVDASARAAPSAAICWRTSLSTEDRA
mmetsp:Transcript_60053/g.142200  ORF Transcript_60053/g.142200 Transcript_60053/m.142200 type:complete len:227 (+) Transcript_60053:999-1679(+)